jgi:hypothetical protein
VYGSGASGTTVEACAGAAAAPAAAAAAELDCKLRVTVEPRPDALITSDMRPMLFFPAECDNQDTWSVLVTNAYFELA